LTPLSDCYRILEVRPGAPEAEVRRAYRILVNVWHPDRFENNLELRQHVEDKLKAIIDAYSAIRDAGFPEASNDVSSGGAWPTGEAPVTVSPGGRRSFLLLGACFCILDLAAYVTLRAVGGGDAAGSGQRFGAFSVWVAVFGVAFTSLVPGLRRRFMESSLLLVGLPAFAFLLFLALSDPSRSAVAPTVQMRPVSIPAPAAPAARPSPSPALSSGGLVETRPEMPRSFSVEPAPQAQGSTPRFESSPEEREGRAAAAASLWYRLGVDHYARGQYAEAAEALETGVRLDRRGHWEAWVNLGAAYYAQQRYGEAIEAYLEATRLKPEDPTAWYDLGLAYYLQGENPKAVEAYRQAVVCAPHDEEAWYKLGLAYIALGDRMRTAEIYTRLKDLKSSRAAAFHKKAGSFLEAGLPIP